MPFPPRFTVRVWADFDKPEAIAAQIACTILLGSSGLVIANICDSFHS
jgi:hypothetical protein